MDVYLCIGNADCLNWSPNSSFPVASIFLLHWMRDLDLFISVFRSLYYCMKYDDEDVFCGSELGIVVFVVCLRIKENLNRAVFIASCNTKLDESTSIFRSKISIKLSWTYGNDIHTFGISHDSGNKSLTIRAKRIT